MTKHVTALNNTYTINASISALNSFYNKLAVNSEDINARHYHVGLKSLLRDNSKNTVYTNGVLTKAEGMSPRWLLMR